MECTSTSGGNQWRKIFIRLTCCAFSVLGVYRSDQCMPEGGSLTPGGAGQSDRQQIRPQHAQGPAHVRSLQGAAVSRPIGEHEPTMDTCAFSLKTYVRINKETQTVTCYLCFRYPFSADQDIPETDWEVYLRETANAIVSQQSPQRWADWVRTECITGVQTGLCVSL